MPKKYKRPKRKWRQLTQADIIKLFREGVYTVDLEKGIVSSGHTGKPLKIKVGGRPDPNGQKEDRQFYELHYKDQRRKIAVSVCIWIVGSGRPVPDGFEIHHRDRDYHNNGWSNLFALFRLDHKKLHNGNGKPVDLVEPVAEEF